MTMPYLCLELLHMPVSEATKRYLITGGSRGLGSGMATYLVQRGHKVAVTYNTTPVHRDDVYAVRCDITSTKEVEAAVAEVEEHLGPIDVLVANAGVDLERPLAHITDEEWDHIVAVNLTGTMKCLRSVSQRMQQRHSGSIVIISSAMANLCGRGHVAYAATKAGLQAMSRALAEELVADGITVNTVRPGPVRTAMFDNLPASTQQAYLDMTRTKTPIEPADVARAVEAISTNPAVIGANLGVDGGAGWGE